MQTPAQRVSDRVCAAISKNDIALPADYGLHHRVEGRYLP